MSWLECGPIKAADRRKECPSCGKVFSSKRLAQVYCGNACGGTAGRMNQTGANALVAPLLMTCAHCGDEFRRKRGGWRTWKFCSRLCFQSYQRATRGGRETRGDLKCSARLGLHTAPVPTLCEVEFKTFKSDRINGVD